MPKHRKTEKGTGMDISSYRAQMVVSPWWTDIFSYFHPVFLWSLIWGQSSIISKLYRNIKSGFDPRCRKRERLLSWIEHVTGHKVVNLNSVWKDGRILCDIIQDSCPETDMSWDHFSGHTFHRGQTLITRCLQIQPAFCESDFARKDLTPELEKRLFRYLSTVRQGLNRRLAATSLSLDDDSDAEPQVADEYIARGMGLLMASRNRHAIFYIYSRDGSSLYNIRIEIQGPEGDYGLAIVTPETQISTVTVTTIPIDYRLTTDYLRVSYQPRNLGNHELSLTHYGYIIPGSPFHICVDDTTNRPGKRYASIDWLTIDEEEEIRKKEEIKKKGKVKCRIVDFVTEQMYLTDDGKLVKILPNTPTSVKSNTPLNKSQKYLTPHEQSYSRSRSRSISPRRKNVHSEKKMYNSLTYKAVKKLLSMTQVKKIVQVTDASAQVQLAEYKTTSVVFKEKCKKIVNTCDFLLKNLPKQTSLDILNNATRILQSPTRHEFKQFPVVDSEELESIITEIKSTAESEIKSTETELTSTAVPKLSVTINSIESDNDDVFLPDVHQLSNKMITNSARFLSSNIYDGLNDISEMISETNTDNPSRLLSDNSLTTEELQHSSRRNSGSEARLSFKQEGNTKSPNRQHSFSAINRSVSQEYLEQQSKLEDDDILTITDNVIDITGTKNYQTLNKSEIFADKSVETDCKNEYILEVKQDESKFKVKGKLVCKIIEQFETHMNSNECSKNDKVINLEGDMIKNKVDGTIKNRKTNQYYSVLNSINFIDNTKENQTENNHNYHNADIYVNNKMTDTEFKELIAENNSNQDKNINNILNDEVKQSQIGLDIFKIDQTNHGKINKGEIFIDNKDDSKTQWKESECTETNIVKTNLNVNNTDVFLNNITRDADFNEKKLTDRVEMTDNGILNEEIKENHTHSDNFKTDKTNYEINKDDIENVIEDDKSKTQLKEKIYTKSNIENNDKKGLLDVNKKQHYLCQNTTPIRDVLPESKRNDTKTTNRSDQEFEIISEKATTPTKNVKVKVNTTANIKKICSLFESNFMNNEKDLKSEGKEKINETVPEKTKSQSDMHILKRPSDFQPKFSSMKTGVQTSELEMKEIEPLEGKIKINKTVFESQSSPSKSEIHSLSDSEQLKEPLEVWEIKSHLCEKVSEITETSENKNTDIKLSTIVDLCNDEYKSEIKFVKPLPFEELKSNYDTSLNKSYNQTKLKSLSLSSTDERVYRSEPRIVIKMIRSEPEIIGEIFRAEPAVVEELFRAEPALVEEFCRSESVEVQKIIGAESSVIRDFTNRMCRFVSSNETYKKYLDSMKGIEDKIYDENKTIFETNQTLMNEIEMTGENCQETNNVKDEHAEPFLKNELKNTDLTIQESKEIKTKPTTISNLDKAEYKRPKVMPRSSNSTKSKVIDIGEVNKFENKRYQNPVPYTKLLSDGEYNFSKENVEIKTEQTENKRSNMLIPKSPDKFIGIRIMPRGWMQENNQISKDRTQTELLLSKNTQGEIAPEQSKQVETIVTEEAVVCIEETTSCETEKIHKLKINDIHTNLNIKETKRDKKENTLDCIFDDKEEGNYTNGCNVDISKDILTFDNTKEIVVELSKEVVSIIPTIETDIITNTAKIIVNEDSKVSEYNIADIKNDITKDKTATIDCEISKSDELIIVDVETIIRETSITEVSEVIISDNEGENKTNIMEVVLSEDRKEMKPFIGDVKSEIITNVTKAVVNVNDKESMPIISIVNGENITHITKSFVSDDIKKSEEIITKSKNDIIEDNTKAIVTEQGIEKESIICYIEDTIAGFTNDTVGEDSKVNESIIADVASKNKTYTKEAVFDRESKELYIVEITADRVARKKSIDGSRPIADAKVKITPDIKIPIITEDEKEKNAMTIDVNDKITTIVMEDAIEEKVKIENVEDGITLSITDDYVAGGFIEKIPNTVVNECEITRDHIVNELKENESIIAEVEVEVKEHESITANVEGEITNVHVAEIITKHKPITSLIEGELTAMKFKQEYTEREKMTAGINSEIKTKHVVAEITEIKPIIVDLKSEITARHISEEINESTTCIENKITILDEVVENIVVDLTESRAAEDSKDIISTVTETTKDIMVDIIKQSLAEVEPTVTETTDDNVVEITKSRTAEDDKDMQPTVTEMTKDIMVDIIKPSLADVEPTVTETTDDIVVEITKSRTAEDDKDMQPTVTEMTKDIMVDIIKPSLADVEPTVTETTDDIVVEITESRAAEDSKDIQSTVTEITKDIMVDIIAPSLADVEPTVTETTDDIVVEITKSRAAKDSIDIQSTVTEITKDIMIDIINSSLAEVEPTVTETTDDIVVEVTESSAAEDSKDIQSTVTETTDDIVVKITESRAAEDSKGIQSTVTEITKDIMVDIIKQSLAEVEPTVTETTDNIAVELTKSRAAEDSKDIQSTVTETTKDIMVDIINPSLAEVEPTFPEIIDDIVVEITKSRTAEDNKDIKPTVTEMTKDIMVDIIKPSLADVESTVTETTDDIVVEVTESSAAEDSKEIDLTVTEITDDIVVEITESRAAEDGKDIKFTVTKTTKDIMVDIIKQSLAEVEPTVTETTDNIAVELTKSRAAEDSKDIQSTVTEMTKDIMVDIIKPSLADVESTVTETSDDIVVEVTESSVAVDSKEIDLTVTDITDDIVVEITESRAAEDGKDIKFTVTENTKDIMVDIIKQSLADVEPTVTETTDDIVVEVTESSAAEDSKEIELTVTEITKDIMIDIINSSLAEVEPTVTETTDDIVVEVTESSAAEGSKEIELTVTEITKDIMIDIINSSLAEVEPTVTETTDDIVVEVTESSAAEDSKDIQSTVTETTKDIMVDIINPSLAEVEPIVPEIIEHIMVDTTKPIVAEYSNEMEADITEDNMTNITDTIVASDRKQDEHIFTENREDIIVDTIKAIIGEENKDHKHYIAQITEGIMVDITETSVPKERKEVESTVTKTTDDIVVHITESNVAKDTTEHKPAITKDIMVDITKPILAENSTEMKFVNTEVTPDIIDIIEPIVAEDSTEVKLTNTELSQDIVVDVTVKIMAEDSKNIEHPVTDTAEKKVADIIEEIETKNIEQIKLTTEITEDVVLDINKTIVAEYSKEVGHNTNKITEDIVLDINKTIVAKDSKDVRSNITEITEAIIIDIKGAIIAEVNNKGESIIVEISEDNMIDITKPIITEESKEDDLITKITEDIMLYNNELIVIEDSQEVKPLITEISEDNKENMIETIKTEESKYIEPITKITEDIMLNMNQHIVVEDSEEVETTIEIREDNILDNTKAIIAKDNKEVEPTIAESMEDNIVDITEAIIEKYSKEDERIIIEITQDVMVDNTEANVIEDSKKIKEVEPNITGITEDNRVDITEFIVTEHSKEGEPNITEIIHDVIVDTTVPIAAKDTKKVGPITTKITENIILGVNEHIVVENRKEIAPAITKIVQDVKEDLIECIVAEDSKEVESIITEITEDREVNITETMAAEHITEFEPTITKITQDNLLNITEPIVAEETKEIESMITNIKEVNIVDITEAIIAEDNKKIKEVELTIIEITQDIMVDITEPIVAEDSKEVESKITEENIVDNTAVIIEKCSKKIKEVEPTITEITQDVLVNITEPVIAEDSKEDEPTATGILEDIMLHITEPTLLENNKVVKPIITEISQDIMVDISELIVAKDNKVVEATQDVMGSITEPIVTKHNKEVQLTTTEFVENILGHIAEESLIKESKEAEDAITEFAADILVNITETLVAEYIKEVELPITEIAENNVADIRDKIVVEDNIEFKPTITKTKVAEYSTEVESTISDIANEMYILEENTKVVEPTIFEIATKNIVEDSKEIETSITEIAGLIVAEDSKDIHPTIKDIAEDFMIDCYEPVQHTITVIAEEMVTDITETIIEEDSKQVEPTIVIEDINEVEPIFTEIFAQDRQVVEPPVTKIAVQIVAGNSQDITEEIVATITENFVPEHITEVKPAVTEIVAENNKGGEPNITEIKGENVTDTIKTYVPDDSKKVESTISELSEDIMVNITEASVVKVNKEVETIIYEIIQNITQEKLGEESNEIESTLSAITEDFIVDIHEKIVTEDREKVESLITEITEDVMVDIAGNIIVEDNKKVEPPITEILDDIMVDSTETIVEEDRKEDEQPITEIVEGMIDNVETIVEEDNKDAELPITIIAYDITADIIKKIVEDSKEDELPVTQIREDIMVDSAGKILEEDNIEVEFPTSEIVKDIMADNAETIKEEDSKEDELRTTKITKDTMVYITEIAEDIMVDRAETIIEEDRKGVEHHITDITEDIVEDITEQFVEEYNKEVELPITEIVEDLIVDIAEKMLEGESKDVDFQITEIVDDFKIDITETIVADDSKEFYTIIANGESEITTGISNILFTKDNKENEVICYADEENILDNTNIFPAQYIKEDDPIFLDFKVEITPDCIADKQNKDIELMSPVSGLNIAEKNAMNDIVEMIAVTETDHVKTGSIEDDTKVQAICVISDLETINVDNTKEQYILAKTELDFVEGIDGRQMSMAIDDIQEGGMNNLLGKFNFAKISNETTMQIKGEYTNVTSDEHQEMVVDDFNLEEKHIKEKKREEQETIHEQTDILKFKKIKKQVDSPSVKSKINSFNMLLKEKELDNNCSYSLTNSKLIKTLPKEKAIQITNSNKNLQEKNMCAIKGFLFSETKRDFELEKLNVQENPSNPPIINSKLFPKNKEKIIINDKIKHFENILPSALSHTSTSLSLSDKQDQNNSVKNRIAEFENTVLVDNLIKREFNKITKTNEKHINEQNEKQELFIFGGKEYEYRIKSVTTRKEDKCNTALDSELKFNVDTVVSDEMTYLEQQNNITKTSYKPKTQQDLNIGKSKESETYLEDISDATSNTTHKSKRNLDVTKVFSDKSNVNKYIENKITSNSELDSGGMVLNTESKDIEDTEYIENIFISNLEYKNDITEMKHNKILDAEVSEYIKETKMKNLKLISDVISNNEKKNDTIIDKEYSEYNEEIMDITEDLEYTGKKVHVSDSFCNIDLDSENIFQVTTTIDSTENEAINVELIGNILKTECENDQVLEIEDMIDNITNKQTQIPFNLEVMENISIVEHECDTKLDVNTLFYETNVEECNESSTILQDNEIIYANNTNEININEYNMNATMMNLEEKTSISEIKNKYDKILQDDEIIQENDIVGESKINANFNLEPLICTVENEYNKILDIDEITENKIVYVENTEDDHKIMISETSNIENQSNTVPEFEQYKTDFFENHEDILTFESSMSEFENECDTIDKDKIVQDNTDVSEGYESLLNAESINNVCIDEQEIKSEDKIIFDECESVISKEMIDEVQPERYTTLFENILQDVTNIHQSIKNEMIDTESNEAMIEINEIENEFEKILDENEIDSEKINIDKIIEDETMLTLEINEITTVDEEFNKILTVNSLQPVKGNIEDVNDYELKKIKGNILFDDENKYNDSENEVNRFNDNDKEEYITDSCIFSSSSFKVVSTNEDNLKTIDDITDAMTEDILRGNNLQMDNSTTQGVIFRCDSIAYSTTAVVKNTNEEFQQLNSILLNNNVFKTTSETNITDMSDKSDKENKLLKDEFDIDLQSVKKSDLSITVLKDIDVDMSEPFNDNILSIDSQERNINDIYNILDDENKLSSTVEECEKVISIVEPYTNEIRQSLEKLDLGEKLINIQINEQNFDFGSGNDIINMCDMLQINNDNYDETVICRKQSIDEMIYLTNNEETNLQELEFRTENESDVQIRNVDLLRDWEDPFEEIQNDKIVNEQLKETIKDINDYDVLNKNLLSVEQELADVINIEDEELDEEIQNELAKLDSTVEVTSDDINKIVIQKESLLIPKDVNIEDEELDLKTQEELIKVDSIEIDEGVKEIDKCRKQFLMKSLYDRRETIEDEELDIDTQAEITKVEKIVLNENDKLMNRNLEHKSSIVDKYITEETFEDVLIDEDEIKFDDDILNKTDDKELETLQSLNDVDNTKLNIEYTNNSLSIQKLNHETIVTDLQTGVTFPDMNNYDFFRGKSINEGLLKPIESTTTSQDSEWSLEENSETYSQHETSFEKNNFTDDNNEILSRPQSINGCTSKSPVDTFTELDDFIGNNDFNSGDFHLWSSNIEFGSPPYKFNLCEEMDFDSIISAPNLDEALKKLDKHIQNKREETTKHENTECDVHDMNIESSGSTILDKTMDDISLEISKYLESESKITVDSAVSSDLTQKLWSVETLDSNVNRSSEFSVWETGIDDSENGNWSPIISSYRYPRVLPPQRSIMSLIDEEEERAMNSPLSRMLSKSQDSFGSIKSYNKLQQGYSQSSEESKNECIGILEESNELNIDELNSIENLDNTRDFIIHQNLVGNIDNTDCIPSNIYDSIGNVSIERRFADLKTSERINFIECELSSDLVTQKGSRESTDFHDIKMRVEQNFNFDKLEGNYISLTDASKTITPEDLDSIVEFTGEIVKSERKETVNINTRQLHDCGVDYHEENDVCEKYSTNDIDISKVFDKVKEGFYILGRLQDESSKQVNVEKLKYQANENREQNISDEVFMRENYYENEINTLEKIENKNKNLNNTIEDGVEETENIKKVLNDTENEDNKSVSLNSVPLKDEILLAEEIGDNFSVNERKRYWDKKLETMKTDDLEMSDNKRVDKIKPGNVSQLVSSFNDVPLENTDTFFKKSDYSLQKTECREIEKEREISKINEQCGDIDVNNLKHSQKENESKHVQCNKIFTDESCLNTSKINYVTSEEPNIIFSEKENMLPIEEKPIHKEDKNVKYTEHIEKETIPPDLVKKWKNYWDEFIIEQNENQTSKHLISNVTGIVSNVKHQLEFSKSIKQEETIMINKLPSVKENTQIETENISIFKKTININDDIQEITTRESDDEIEEDSHYIDKNDLFLQKVKETHIETKNIVLERIKLFEKGNNTDLNENNKHGFSRNSIYNSSEKHTDSTKWKNNMQDIDNEINTQEKLSDNNLLEKPIERVRSYSTGNIDIDVGLGNDENNYKKNIVEGKEIEGKNAPKSNDDKIDCKIRFERAKQFFKVLEKTNIGERQDRCYHSMPRMDIALIRDSKLSIDSDSGTETRCQRKRDRIRGRRKKKKDIKVRSAPTSDTESCKRISDREEYNFGSERHKKLSERFHVKGLFRDISGDSDGFFRGIPHREAVLASLRSVDDVTVSPYEMDYRKLRPSKSVSSIPEGFQEEYPYLPTTPPSRYRPRSALEFHLIPRSVLLDLNI